MSLRHRRHAPVTIPFDSTGIVIEVANQDHLAALKCGVDRWNGWRKSNPSIVPDLSGADLGGLDLRRADLRGVDLSEARLDAARLVGAYYCGATKWPTVFDLARSGVLPFRTNSSKSLFFRETAGVIWRSVPILITQALIAMALAYTGQGRGLLSLGQDQALKYLVVGNAVAGVAFARILARRVIPDPTADPASDDRIRWLALECGAIVVGLITGFLPAVAIEIFVSEDNCGISREVLVGYGYAATETITLILLPLWFYAAWRALKGSPSRAKSLVWLIIPAASPLIVWITPGLYSTVFILTLIALGCIRALTALKGPAPNKVYGGTFGRRDQLIAVLFVALGAYVAVRPASLPSGPLLFVLPTFWTTIAVLMRVYLQRLWESRLWLFCAAGTLLVLGTISLSRLIFNAHEIRTLSGKPATRPSLNGFAKLWLRTRLTAPHTKDAPYTVVLVAAAGGGIRSAYWTARLLGWLQDKNPSFRKHLFAISGVSGGSVGAGIFAALLKENCGGHCEASASRILRGDFLAPALGSLLTRDLIGTIGYPKIPDRAVALEQKFEREWRDSVHTSTLEESLDQLWNTDSDLAPPSLFFNSTEAGSAKRVVFTNISMAGVPSLNPTIEAVAQSLPLRLSTAMLLSARFPYISPEGLAGKNGQYRFVDGGYFDNSGAATLLDIVHAIRDVSAELDAADRVQIAVLVIESEPIVAANCARLNPGGLGTPLEILDQLRQARAEDFLQSLRDHLTDRERTLFIDSLRPKSGDAEFPLGWTLPFGTVLEMYKQVPEVAEPVLNKLAGLLD